MHHDDDDDDDEDDDDDDDDNDEEEDDDDDDDEVNGQWSMPARQKGEPILGTGGEKKNYIMYIVLDRIPSHLAKNCKTHQRVQPNVGGILPPPAMTPNLCIDRKH